MLRQFGSRGEVRRRPFGSGRVDEDDQGTRSRNTAALSLYVECRLRIACHAFIPLREKCLDSSSTRISSGPSEVQEWLKEGFSFYLVSPLSVFESVCEASTVGYIYFIILSFHFELSYFVNICYIFH